MSVLNGLNRLADTYMSALDRRRSRPYSFLRLLGIYEIASDSGIGSRLRSSDSTVMPLSNSISVSILAVMNAACAVKPESYRDVGCF